MEYAACHGYANRAEEAGALECSHGGKTYKAAGQRVERRKDTAKERCRKENAGNVYKKRSPRSKPI